MYELRMNDYDSFELYDMDGCEVWSGTEEDVGIEFIDGTEIWEDGYMDKIHNFFLKNFGIKAEQIEERF